MVWYMEQIDIRYTLISWIGLIIITDKHHVPLQWFYPISGN